MFPAEVPKRLPDNEDARELPKPSAAPIYSLCRKTQWGSVALNIKLIERSTKRLCTCDFTGFWGINLHWIMHYVKLLNYNAKLLFISVSVTCGVVLSLVMMFHHLLPCFKHIQKSDQWINFASQQIQMKKQIILQSNHITPLLHNECWDAFIFHQHICLETTAKGHDSQLQNSWSKVLSILRISNSVMVYLWNYGIIAEIR